MEQPIVLGLYNGEYYQYISTYDNSALAKAAVSSLFPDNQIQWKPIRHERESETANIFDGSYWYEWYIGPLAHNKRLDLQNIRKDVGMEIDDR